MYEPRKISLVGDSFSLNFLERVFNTEDVTVFSEIQHEEKMYYIRSLLFEKLDEKQLRSEGGKMIGKLNSICCFAREGYIPVEFGDVYIGNRIYILMEDYMTVRDDLCLAVNGLEDDYNKNIILNIYDKMNSNNLLNNMLSLLFEKGNNWVNLYRILDLFKANNIDVIGNEWITKNDLKLLKHTANSPTATGNESRHGKQSGIPPENPMPLSIAQSLVKNIIWHYTNSLCDD